MANIAKAPAPQATAHGALEMLDEDGDGARTITA
jgi:hypothetical protein